MNSNKLNPANNKSLFHSLSDVFGQVLRDEMKEEKANTLCNIAGKMQKSLELEISRFKAINGAEGATAKFREIETKMLDDNQIKLDTPSDETTQTEQ